MSKTEFVDKSINADPEIATKIKALAASQQEGLVRLTALITNNFDSFADFEQALRQYGSPAQTGPICKTEDDMGSEEATEKLLHVARSLCNIK